MLQPMFPRLLGGALLLAALSNAAEVVEFNRDIRPIFSDKCFACHGPDPANRKTKMRLDQERGAKIPLTGGRVSIVPGDAAGSEIYRRISSDLKAVRMPPAWAGKDKLSAKEIDLIRRWIEQGAKWEAHWSFLPPKRAPIPDSKWKNWPKNPIDNFVAYHLAAEGLHPAAEANRMTLIRRVTLDLTGLPPTPAAVDAFLRDSSADAYEKVVDRLLASPRYAERMAFRWMEAARYADTNGYQMDGPRDMWRWRDWVIHAFDQNMPFDEFTVDQLAGDLLPHPTLDQRIATAFNRNHRTNSEGGIVPEEFRVEYVVDRAATTSTVWLGLTMGCARCHDHKYDPITQKDFYSFYAFFNHVPEKGLVYNFGNDEPNIKAPTPAQQLTLRQLDHEVAAAQKAWTTLAPRIAKAQRQWEKTVRKAGTPDWNVTDGLVFHQQNAASEKASGCGEGSSACEVKVTTAPAGKGVQLDGKRFIETTDSHFADFDYLEPFTFAAWVKPDSPDGAILSHSEDYFEGSGHGLYILKSKLRLHVVFRWTDIGMRVESAQPLKIHEWQHVLVTYDGKRNASGVHMYVDGRPVEINILFDELSWPMKAKRPFRIGAGGGLRFQGEIADVRIYKIALSGDEAAVVPVRATVQQIAILKPEDRTVGQSNKLRLCFLQRAAPQDVAASLMRLREARAERERFYETVPTVMVMQESAQPRDSFVLKRGAYDAPGDKVTARVPGVLPPLDAGLPNNRLGLARWLVDRSNPLTARVTVNRFWQMYFGTGLVKTVDDFGSQGEWPLYKDLLDWLAVDFMDTGWNVKAMQKLVVMSATYRQSSNVTPDLLERDPENRLLARGPRLRLGPEMIRDQALSVSGLLVEKIGGPSVKPYQPPGLWQELAGGKGYEPDQGEGLYRRSLYTYWKRTVAPPFMVNFDSPNRETCTVRETRTNTPLQALDLMNDETFLEASRKLAERTLREGGSRAEQRINYLYRLVLARDAKDSEERVMLSALQSFGQRFRTNPKAAADYLSYGFSNRDKKFDPTELAAYATLANLMLNLSETITKD
jgi:mono/diheme cytochrome c family protein